MEMYQVGGAVRDEILGLPSNDIDFSVVLTEEEKNWTWNGGTTWHETLDPFPYMVSQLKRMGFKIFLETPEFLTVRAQFPKGGGHWADGRSTNGLTADFVLARKESAYTDGRRPDVVEPGTLMDDLRRRDFTMNAIAKAADGSLIDPFCGQQDITNKIIRTVGGARERFSEDALRAVRALRFSVTKGFMIHPSVEAAMQSAAVLDAIENKISDERIKDELSKMFRHDTVASLIALNNYPALRDAIFSGRVHLDSTLKQKGFK